MKDIAVIGLGRFGWSIAREYSRMGGNVLAIDYNEEIIQEISPFVTSAVRADVSDAEVLKTLGLSNMDAVVIGIAENMEAAIMSAIAAKEEGVPYVIAKCKSEVYAKIMKKVGVDAVILPEKEMGKRTAYQLSMENLLGMMNLSEEFSVAEVKVPKKWIGKNLIELDIRKKYGVNVIMKKSGKQMDINIDPQKTLDKEDILVVVGENKMLERIF